jgi:demethylspheroidene O-methyltransferase
VTEAPGEPWRDRYLAARDRLLGEPKFRGWAARFRLTRPIARRRARALFDLCAGFVYSQVLLACVRLGLFDLLAERPRSLAEIAERLDLPPAGAERLAEAAASLRLLEHRSRGRYGLGPLGAAVAGDPAIAAMVEHHELLYADLRDPVALLRSGGAGSALARYWPYAGADRPQDLTGEQVARYSELMAVSQSLVAEEILDAYPVDRHRRLLDVGGGEGAFLERAAARAPGLELVLYDLPSVVERARARFAAAGLAARAAAVGGNFLRDALPAGADLVSLVRVLHDHDDPSVARLLAAVRRALAPGGRVLVAEPMAGTPGARPIGDAYFGFYLLAMGSGRPRTPLQLEALLQEAGFAAVRHVPTRVPLQTGLIVAAVEEWS